MDATASQSSQWDSKNPVKWSEIMRALDPQELPDWPLLSQDVIGLKCKLCSRTFYSTINYRRHERFHVQQRNNPDWLSDTRKKNYSFKEFWHKRSRDIIKDIFSLQDVGPKGVTWRTIVEELTSIPKANIRLPPAYFKARNWLLDTVKSKEPEFSKSPDKFLELLSGGSEKTFIDNDMDESVQSHVFRDAEEIALAQENLVATACFLLEQKLHKVWHAHCKDETTSLQNELIMEEEDEKRRQPKTEGNKMDGKKKKNKPKKQIVVDKSEKGKLGQTSDTQQSTATSRPEVPTSVEENSLTPVAQLEHLPDASHIRDAKQEDGECKKKEGSKEQKSEEGKNKKRNKKNKKSKKQIAGDKSEEGNHGQKSDIQQSTATSIPEVPTFVEEEDSQTPVAQLPDASHIHDAKKEDGECKQEEGLKEQKSEDKICQDMTKASDSLLDGGGPSSEHPIRTQVTE